MKTIELRIPELGKASGTTKWMSEKLEIVSNTLRVSNLKDGRPCLVCDDPYGRKKQNGEVKSVVIIFPDIYEIEYSYRSYNDMCIVYPTETIDQCGLFLYLTDKAKVICTCFLNEIAKEFKAKLENA